MTTYSSIAVDMLSPAEIKSTLVATFPQWTEVA